jgi:hypothetical protein
MFKEALKVDLSNTPNMLFLKEAISYYNNEKQSSTAIPPADEIFPEIMINVNENFWANQAEAIESIHVFVDVVIKVMRETQTLFGQRFAIKTARNFSFEYTV